MHSDPHPRTRRLLRVSLPIHHTASRPHSLAFLSNPGLRFSVKCSLFETENLTSTNGCIFSRALCHKMILLSPFTETGNRIAEIGRSTLLKASANLREHKVWFFRVLISIALYLVTAQVPFDCVCNHESFTLVSDRGGSHAVDQSNRQPIISDQLWGVWPDQRHAAKFSSEASWAAKALKKRMLGLLMENITSSCQVRSNSFQPVACFSMNSSLLGKLLDCCKGIHASTRKTWVWKSKLWKTLNFAQMPW